MIFEYHFAGCSVVRVEVASFEEASRIYQEAIERTGVGASSCFPTKVIDHRGKTVAWVSYNGRVWGPKKWKTGDKPLREAARRVR